MQLNLAVLGLSGFILLSGCAHIHQVKSPQTDAEVSASAGVRVEIGSNEVREGEKVDVLDRKCHETRGTRLREPTCHYVKVGEARVTRILDSESAIVTPENGMSMRPSMRVEKQKR